MGQGIRKVLSNTTFRAWVVISAYVLLYFMYAENDALEKKAREFGLLINLNQIFLVTMQGWLTLEWYFQAQNKAYKTLFLSFSIFCLLRLLYRLIVLVLDRSLVSMTPQYIMMILIVIPLLYLERKWGQSK